MVMSAISTTARRITRHVNSLAGEPRTWMLHFDQLGNPAGQSEPGSLRDFPAGWELTGGQGRKVTQREVQDLIDARAGLGRMLATATPAEREELGYA